MSSESIKKDLSILLLLLKEPYFRCRVPIGGFSNGYMDMEIHDEFVLLDGDILSYDKMREDEIKAFYYRLAIIINLKLKLVGIKFIVRE